MTADQYPTGTVARVRVGEWEGRAGREPGVWILIGHPQRRAEYDVSDELTVLHVELPAPVEEPKAFGARVLGLVRGGVVEQLVRSQRVDRQSTWPWVSESGHAYGWVSIANPVVLHDPEATA